MIYYYHLLFTIVTSITLPRLEQQTPLLAKSYFSVLEEDLGQEFKARPKPLQLPQTSKPQFITIEPYYPKENLNALYQQGSINDVYDEIKIDESEFQNDNDDEMGLLNQTVQLIQINQEKKIQNIVNTIEVQRSLVSWTSMLFIICLTLVFSSLLYLKDQVVYRFNRKTFKIFLCTVKDIFIALPIIMIALLINYIIEPNTRYNLNIFNVFDYIDIDKLLINIVSFLILWILVALVFSIALYVQSSHWKQLESQCCEKDKLFRQYENLYINNPTSPQLQIIHEKVQYLVIRQTFIAPTYSVPLVPQFLREDFDFGMYLTNNCGHMYQSIMRISLSTLILFILSSYSLAQLRYYSRQDLFYMLGVVFPLFFMLLLKSLLRRQGIIQAQIIHRVDSPYDFRLVHQDIVRNPLNLIDNTPVPKFIQMEFRPNRNSGRCISLFFRGSKAQEINLIHCIVFLHSLWFIWFFQMALIPGSLLFYMIISLSPGLACYNIFIIVPQLVNLMAVNMNMHGMRSKKAISSVIRSQQLKQQEFAEKLSHLFRGEVYQTKLIERISYRNSSQQQQQTDIFSMTVGQKDILKNAFLMTIQTEGNKQINDQLKSYEEELNQKLAQEDQNDQIQLEKVEVKDKEESEDLEDKKIENESQDENEENGQKKGEKEILNTEQEIQVQEVKLTKKEQKNLIIELLKEKREELDREFSNFSEESLISLVDLDNFTKLCGGEMKLWYQLLLSQTFFKDDSEDDKIQFSHIVEYSGFNQKIIEMGINPFIEQTLLRKFQEKISFQQLREKISYQNLESEEIDFLIRDLKSIVPNQFEINHKQIKSYLVDSISSFPQ